MARHGLETTDINIWADPGAAAIVRSIAGGNETVPTVVVGDTELVNPSAAKVVDAVRALGSGLLPDQVERRPAADWLQISQWVAVGIAILASFALDATGHAAVSWALDVVAAVLYIGFRLARRRRPDTARSRPGR